MARKKSGRPTDDTDRTLHRSGQTPSINARNNNQDVASTDHPASEEANVKFNNEGIGDSTWNNDKLTDYTSNHSADA